MKAFITIEYEPEIEYKIKERELFLNLALATELASKKEPEYFTLEEIYKILKDKGDIRISYCQECEIKSTGNIIISGKGEYISNLNAMKDIIFTKSESVARGGMLIAGGNISAGIIGSSGYVATTLKVTKSGTISATLAYKNTIFCFDNLKMTLDETLEDIYVYFDKDTRRIEVTKSGLS